MESPKTRTEHLLGPLDDPGFHFSATGLVIDPDVTYEEWERYGRKLQLADKGIQWALGDWIVFGENHPDSTFRERASQAVEFAKRKVKTLQNYATVAKAIDKSRRRDSDEVDFSTHAEVASLPEDEQEKILARAADDMDYSTLHARRDAKRVKRKLKLIPDEVDLIHAPEVQEYLDKYIDGLHLMDEAVPSNALFLRNMIQSHIAQAHWQKERTVEGDYEVIQEAVEETLGPEDEIFMWLINRGYFMSDPDLDERLETLALHSILDNEYKYAVSDKKPPSERSETHHKKCECTSLNKRVYAVKQGGRKDTQRGDMVTVYHPRYEGTGDSVNVARANSIYDMGERE